CPVYPSSRRFYVRGHLIRYSLAFWVSLALYTKSFRDRRLEWMSSCSMSHEKQIPLIEVSGGDFECGEAIGKALQQQVHENIESYMEVFAKEAGVTLEVVREYAKRLIPTLQGYAPD